MGLGTSGVIFRWASLGGSIIQKHRVGCIPARWAFLSWVSSANYAAAQVIILTAHDYTPIIQIPPKSENADTVRNIESGGNTFGIMEVKIGNA